MSPLTPSLADKKMTTMYDQQNSKVSIQRKIARYDFPFYLVLIFLLLDYGRPQSFFPIIGKLHLGMIVQIVLFLNLILRNRFFTFNNIQTKCFLGLILLMTLHVPIATNNYWAFMIWKNITLYFIVYLSIINFVDSFAKIKKYIDIWIMINLLCAIIGIKNGGKVPGSGFMGDENDFALVMNMVIPFAYFMFLETNSARKRIFYILSIGIFITASVASLSRGGFIGLAAVGSYCWLKTPKKLLATVVIAFMVALLYCVATEQFWEEVRSIKEENIERGTGYQRWFMWNCAWKMFLDNPIIGVGQDNFRWNMQKYEPPDINVYWHSHRGKAVHSLYFTLIPELGIVGIVLFSGMLYTFYRNDRWIKSVLKKFSTNKIKNTMNGYPSELLAELKKLPFITRGVNGSLIGYLVSGIFLSVLYYPHFWLLIGLNTAIENVSKKEIRDVPVQI